jgi:hypothetical protein
MADLRKMFSAIREGEATWKSFTEKEDGVGEGKPEIKAPKAKGKKEADAPVDRAPLLAEIKALYDALPPAKIDKAMKAVACHWQDGESWEQLPNEKLVTLRSLLSAAK